MLKVTTAQPLIALTSMNVTLALTTVPPPQTASTLTDPFDVAILNTTRLKVDANRPGVHGARRPATTTLGQWIVWCVSDVATDDDSDDDNTDTNVNECPKGQFTNRNFTCQDCPLNTYNNIDGTTQTSCIPCPENHITHTEGSTSVADCKRKHSVDS